MWATADLEEEESVIRIYIQSECVCVVMWERSYVFLMPSSCERCIRANEAFSPLSHNLPSDRRSLSLHQLSVSRRVPEEESLTV